PTALTLWTNTPRGRMSEPWGRGMPRHAASPPPWFAFVVHPRDLNDLERSSAGSLLRFCSVDSNDFLEKANAAPPMVVGEIHFGFAIYGGELVCAPRTSDRLLTDEGGKTVKGAVALAVDRGAKVVGLGGLPAPATGGGLRIVRSLPADVTL